MVVVVVVVGVGSRLGTGTGGRWVVTGGHGLGGRAVGGHGRGGAAGHSRGTTVLEESHRRLAEK